MPWLILAVCLLIGGWLLARWYATAQPADILRAVRWTAATLLVVGLAAIALSGRWNLLWMLLFPAVPLLTRWRAIKSMQKNARGPTGGQTSQVDTRFLRMELDHDTGDMDGEVREGPFVGSRLSALKLGEAIELWRAVAQADEQSRIVLESYLDRAHPEWRDVVGEAATSGRDEGAGNAESPWARGDMSVEEARQILGVDAETSDADIEAAWRREMKKAHPDQGGSDWMAAKVNQAKDTLLKR